MFATYTKQGDPSEETLYIIEAYEGDYKELARFICEVWHPLRGLAWYDNDLLSLDTQGVGHNEVIIESMRANESFWAQCYKGQCGNKFTFKVV